MLGVLHLITVMATSGLQEHFLTISIVRLMMVQLGALALQAQRDRMLSQI